MASYFSYFPNVYVGEGLETDESFKYRLVKNIFRRVKPREDLEKYTTLFEAYSIREGDTPASIAYNLYTDVHLDWVILLVNNITDFYTQWPKSEYELQRYVEEAYENPDAVHHYETNEILYNGIVYVKEGIQVNSTFRVTMPDGTTLTQNESIYPVSNYEHEQYENEKKRLIVIPQANIVDIMISEMNELLDYESHIELDEFNNKKTPLSLASLFLKNDSSTSLYDRSSSTANEVVTSFDYGPTASGVSSVASTISAVGVANTASVTTTTSSSSSSSGSSGSSGGSGY